MSESYRIIIAEDQHMLASLLARLILRIYSTAKVRTFGDGQDALDAYDVHGADLLFVNRAMPRIDGITLIRTLRARGDTVPIVGMSGCPHYRDAYMAAGAMAFMSGPELLGELAQLLGRFHPALTSMDPYDLIAPYKQRAHGIGGE